MKVKMDDHKITLIDLPFVQWLAGLVFVLGGLYIAVPSLLSPSGVNIFTLLFGLVFVFAGYQAGLSARYKKITIDRWLKTVKVREIGLLHYSNLEFPSKDIEKFYSETDTDSENSKTFTLCLALKTGRVLVLGAPFQNKAECETVIKTAQNFLQQMEFPERYQPKYL